MKFKFLSYLNYRMSKFLVKYYEWFGADSRPLRWRYENHRKVVKDYEAGE